MGQQRTLDLSGVQALVTATDTAMLMLYPHVMLSCLALLALPSTELFERTLPLLLTVCSCCGSASYQCLAG